MATIQRTGELVKAALQVLAESPNGHLPVREVLAQIEKKIVLTDREKSLNNSGVVRWQTNLRWYSVDAVRAGWLVKRQGVWYVTEEGRKALALDPLTLFRTAAQKYEESRQGQSRAEKEQLNTEEFATEGDQSAAAQKALLEQSIEAARKEIEAHIVAMKPYPFQAFIAALLRGMGYYTPFVAPPGKDGGLDIIAYRDPFGSTPPRLKVQVKHRDQKVTVKEVRELIGLLSKEGDAGLIASSSGFTADAEREMRNAKHHLESMDLEQIISLWEEHYDNMKEADREFLRLRRVSFLDAQRSESEAL